MKSTPHSDNRPGTSQRLVSVLVWAYFLIVLALSSAPAGATGARSLPPSQLFDRGLSDRVQRLDMTEVDPDPLIAEDLRIAQSGEPHMPRFATAIETAVGPHNAGQWEQLADGSELWRLRIHSSGALNLNLHLARFALPPGGAMWVHDPAGAQVHGPYTLHNQNRVGALWTPVVLGDEIELEIAVPPGTRDQVRVEVAAVNHGYRPFGGEQEVPLTKVGEDCNIDVICPEGDGWREQIRSVARISVAGVGMCSANLLNNTAEDDAPLLLTAQHCVKTPGHALSMVVYWNYESPLCGLRSGGNLSDNQSGAEMLASWEFTTGSDFSLVMLDEKPDDDFGVFYAGWDASGVIPQGAVGIHHPGAKVKAISFDNDPLTRVNFYGYGIHQWRIGQWELGTTEGGSSGSCIFEPSSGLCVGTLTTGSASCANPAGYDIYGAFDVHWSGDGTPATRLSDWLDPLDSGQLTLAGRDSGGGGGGGGGQILWLIPAAASAPGAEGSNWKSQIVVLNPTTSTVSAQLHYTADGVSWPGVPLLDEPAIIPAGQSLYIDDPLGPRRPTSGMLFVILDGEGGIVSSRTYNVEAEGSTFGQGIPGVLVNGASMSSSYILPLVHNAPGIFRTNVGVVQASAGEFEVRVSAFAPDGAMLGSGTFTSRNAFHQINNIFRELGINDLEVYGGWLKVDLLGAAPYFWTCYASVIDSRTNDPTYVVPVEP